MAGVSRLTIAQVTPYAWESGHEVNVAIARTAERLAARGHRVAIVAPSASVSAVRDTKRLLREPERVWAGGRTPTLAVGAEVLPGIAGRARAALPVDVGRTIDELLERIPFDIVHVHEPWAPSVASAALRTSPALTVGTFHAPTERAVATQVARKLVQLVFGRLDARVASFGATASLMERFFGGEYRVVLPGADATERTARTDGPLRFAFVDAEERAALRLFLRALRRLDPALEWEATVVSDRGPSSSTPLRAQLRERIAFVGADGEAEALEAADVVVAASDGAAPAPASCCARSRRARSRSPRACPPTRSCSPTESAACSSCPATATCSPPSSPGSWRTRTCASACAPPATACARR